MPDRNRDKLMGYCTSCAADDGLMDLLGLFHHKYQEATNQVVDIRVGYKDLALSLRNC